MIPWREKLRAFGIHFVTTLFVAALAAALIFFVWYPAPFDAMLGGLKLFSLITIIDLALGPLCSLVVYDSRKSRRALVFDYTVIAILQVSALAYGVYSVSQNRPVFVAFVKDRLEVIAAGEIDDKGWQEAAGSKFRAPSWTGPQLVATYVRPEDSNDALEGGLTGRDVGLRPKFFVDYSTQAKTIRGQIRELPGLERRHKEAGPLIAAALLELGRPAGDLGWVPVKHTRGFWTALMDRNTGYPVKYLPIDPY